jgi:hypothetical protein
LHRIKHVCPFASAIPLSVVQGHAFGLNANINISNLFAVSAPRPVQLPPHRQAAVALQPAHVQSQHVGDAAFSALAVSLSQGHIAQGSTAAGLRPVLCPPDAGKTFTGWAKGG